MNPPTVSVIIPNYNYARYLDGRMASVFNQTFQDFEVIILDDASTDGSAALIEHYRSHPKVTNVEINSVNSGSPFVQWRKGVELARGKYIWIAEADDLADKQFLQTHVDLLDSHPEAVLSFAGAEIIDSDGKITGRSFDMWRPENLARPEGYRIFDGKQYIVHNMYWGDAVYNASGAVFRRDMVSAADFDKCAAMRNSGDWLFWTRLIAKGKNIEIYSRLNRFRIHGTNTTAQGHKSGNLEIENMRVIRYIEQNFPVGFYRRAIRRGLMIKRLKRSDMPDNIRQLILAEMRSQLGASKWAYWFERVHKLLQPLFPGMLTPGNDRI